MLTVGSLFSGIGGLDLGLERAGMEVIWQSEIDPYACKVLSKHWPAVVNHGNIKDIQWGDVVRPDVICGGYPCQPFSMAGQRKGEEDPRHLWPWVREAISVLRPRYAILENVQGHLTLGGTTVIKEITQLGYDCEWRVVSASSVGAHHRRNRVIIVAYPNDSGIQSGARKIKPQPDGFCFNESSTKSTAANNKRVSTETEFMADIKSESCNGRNNDAGVSMESEEVSESGDNSRPVNMADPSGIWGSRRGFAFEGINEEVRRHGIRSAEYWADEPRVGRMADGVPNRVDRLKGLGNAVVPQMAELIGRMVIDHDSNK
jgi:DNA (cytosine-5)-methyltransferase 1